MDTQDAWSWWDDAIKKAGSQQGAGNGPWLIMVYLAGDNNLSEEMVQALQGLLPAGPPAGDRIVAQLDPSGLGLPTQRYDLSVPRGAYLHEYLVPGCSIEESNTGNPNALAGFIRWAHDSYGKATAHRLLILSGHGSGTTEDFFMRDDNSMDALSIPELEQALEDAYRHTRRKIDILGMDSCFMSMLEVCYQVRKHVDILIGAEGMEPGFGWPYGRILDSVRRWRAETANVAHPDGIPMDPEALATAIVTAYVEHYSDYDRSAGRSVDLAAIRLGRMRGLAAAVGRLAQALTAAAKSGQADKVTLAHWRAQTYKLDQYVDLKDLCDQLTQCFSGRGKRERTIRDCCDHVRGALGSQGAILRAGCSGFAYQYSHGLSIYFPWALVSEEYRQLAFGRSCASWLRFIKTQVRQTRRPARVPGFRVARTDPQAAAPVVDLAVALARSQVGSLARMLARRPGAPVRGQLKQSLVTIEKALAARRKALAAAAIGGHGGAGTLMSETLDEVFRHGGFGALNSRYTTGGSRYTTGGSRYTTGGSRYTTGGSRSPTDREAAVKNLSPVVGKAYWPS